MTTAGSCFDCAAEDEILKKKKERGAGAGSCLFDSRVSLLGMNGRRIVRCGCRWRRGLRVRGTGSHEHERGCKEIAEEGKRRLH
jgi:hypothetical protein